ncbi:PrpF domain-containing protein, partial [Neisseria sp. P0018.S001]|uniref:PrpF domain-containing protein n=1 Tax=Neisseria sp. P0018.S001 TaxID=3436787 RepID=UPI003F81EF4C
MGLISGVSGVATRVHIPGVVFVVPVVGCVALGGRAVEVVGVGLLVRALGVGRLYHAMVGVVLVVVVVVVVCGVVWWGGVVCGVGWGVLVFFGGGVGLGVLLWFFGVFGVLGWWVVFVFFCFFVL